MSTSPSKIHKDTLLHSSQLIYRPIDHERSGDLEQELSPEQIIVFLKNTATAYKEELRNEVNSLN